MTTSPHVRVLGIVLLAWMGVGTLIETEVQSGILERNRLKWVVRDLYGQFPDEHVRSLTEHPKGVLWFGTWGEGLVRYDGRTRRSFRAKDGLPSDFIRRVSVGPDGRIWVAGRLGVASMEADGSGLETITRDDGLFPDDVFGMDIDSKGRVWVSGSGGAARIDPDGTLLPLAVDHLGLEKNRGRAIEVDEIRGVVWFGWDDDFVNAYDLETGAPSTNHPTQIYCQSDTVNDVELDAHNNLWVACDWGTFLFDGETIRKIGPENPESDWGCGGLCAGPDGKMWLALQIGIALYDNGALTFFDWRDGLLQDNVNDIHVSEDESVWVGTTAGVSFLTPSPFLQLDAPHAHDFRYMNVLIDSKDRIWSGGADLSYLEGGTWNSLNLIDEHKDDVFSANLVERGDGSIVSAWNFRGVHVWRNGAGEWLPDPADPDQRFRGLAVDSRDRIYLGSDNDGVFVFEEGVWRKVEPPPSGEFPPVLSLGFDKEGALWVGGENALFRHRDGRTEEVEFPYNGVEVTFHEILAGPDGDLYFATEGFGVAVKSGDEWRFYNKDNSPLSTTKVYALGFDADQRLWVGSRSNGLFRLQDGGCFHYQRTEGLPPCRVSDLSIAKDGKVYMATYDMGVIALVPERSPPDTFLEDIPREGLLGENLVIRLGGSDAWQSTMMKRLQFVWRLNNDEWSAPSPERVLSIQIDAPGVHRFQAAAIDMDGNIDPHPEEALLRVVYPWWKHPVVILLSLVLVGAILLVIFLLLQRSKRLDKTLRETHSQQTHLESIVEERTRALRRSEEKYRRLAERLEESNRFKERLIANVSHDFRTPLTSLQGYAQLLASKSPGDLTPDQEEFLQIILNNATRMGLLIHNVAQAIQHEGMDRPIDFKPVGLMEVVWNSIRAQSIRAKDQGVDLEMVSEGNEEDAYILASQPLVERLLDNLISNGIKFTHPGGKVLVRIDTTDDAVILEVEDTGIGIDPKEIPRLFERFHKADQGEMAHAGGLGLGLAICKEIADAHGAQIEVESTPGKGSLFRVIWHDRTR